MMQPTPAPVVPKDAAASARRMRGLMADMSGETVKPPH